MDSARTRKNLTAILQGISKVGQNTIAETLDLSETKVSRFKSEEAEMVAGILDVIGLKCVPVELQCYKQESIQSILTLAKERMAQLETPEQLEWDE